jgi:hypothetical protein
LRFAAPLLQQPSKSGFYIRARARVPSLTKTRPLLRQLTCKQSSCIPAPAPWLPGRRIVCNWSAIRPDPKRRAPDPCAQEPLFWIPDDVYMAPFLTEVR